MKWLDLLVLRVWFIYRFFILFWLIVWWLMKILGRLIWIVWSIKGLIVLVFNLFLNRLSRLIECISLFILFILIRLKNEQLIFGSLGNFLCIFNWVSWTLRLITHQIFLWKLTFKISPWVYLFLIILWFWFFLNFLFFFLKLVILRNNVFLRFIWLVFHKFVLFF